MIWAVLVLPHFARPKSRSVVTLKVPQWASYAEILCPQWGLEFLVMTIHIQILQSTQITQRGQRTQTTQTTQGSQSTQVDLTKE